MDNTALHSGQGYSYMGSAINNTMPPLLVCMGDSLTRGDTGMGFHAREPWPEGVARRLGIDVINCGHDGSSTSDYRLTAEWQQARNALPHAKAMTIGLGTNDIDLEGAHDDTSLAHVAKAIESLGNDAINLAGPNLGIAVLSVPQMAVAEPMMTRFDRAGIDTINNSVAVLNAELMHLCYRRRWRFADYAAAFNQRRELYGNTIHPNENGYTLIADVLTPQLATLLL